MKFSTLALLAAAGLAAARAPLRRSLEYRHIERRDSVSPTLTTDVWNNFHFFNQYAGSAYCDNNDASNTSNGGAISCSNVCPSVMADHAVSLLEFNTVVTDTRGYVAYDPVANLIVISFRGSSSIPNWIDNLNFIFTDCSWLAPGCEVHEGFYGAWTAVQDEVTNAVKSAKATYPSATIVATGHSLGAALALICAAQLRVDGMAVELYNYGCPRTFNPTGAAAVSNQPGGAYRMTHLNDIVPQVPPTWAGFAHTSPEFWLSDGTTTTINYNESDVKFCTGYQNSSCNAGTLGSVDAHYYYLIDITEC